MYKINNLKLACVNNFSAAARKGRKKSRCSVCVDGSRGWWRILCEAACIESRMMATSDLFLPPCRLYSQKVMIFVQQESISRLYSARAERREKNQFKTFSELC